MDYNKKSLEFHKKYQGKIEVKLVKEIKDKKDLAVIYTPGVAEVSRKIANNKKLAYEYTIKGRSIAVVSDGTAVLGLGDIGPEASLPVMEGKCALFKQFANIDAWPIVLDTKDSQEIIKTIRNIASGFAGINLEDISAPRCFEIEESLQDLGIPVFHDDQHGTAIVVLAGLINASKVVNKKISDMKIVVSGSGSAGIAIVKLLQSFAEKPADIIVLDSKGIISKTRKDLNSSKKEILLTTNINNLSGDLKTALRGADVFIGVSAPGILTSEMVSIMSDKSIIFALANPIPEIMPDIAKKAGAMVVATGRSDFSNQINNVLVFPGIFKGAIRGKKTKITLQMKLAAAKALANIIKKPTEDKIIPDPFDKKVPLEVSRAVENCPE